MSRRNDEYIEEESRIRDEITSSEIPPKHHSTSRNSRRQQDRAVNRTDPIIKNGPNRRQRRRAVNKKGNQTNKSVRTTICHLNIRQDLISKHEEADFHDLVKGADAIHIHESGKHGNSFRTRHGEVYEYLKQKSSPMLDRHAKTNRIATFINLKNKGYAKDVTPNREKSPIFHNSTWTELNNSHQKPWYICNVYIAGSGSMEYPGRGEQIIACWESLEQEILHFQSKGSILVTSDANAHTQTASDGRESQRINQDTAAIDFNGRCLLGMCQRTELRILGEGQYTRRDPAGRPSTSIDYALVSASLYHECTIQVDEVQCVGLSDHNMLRIIVDRSVGTQARRTKRRSNHLQVASKAAQMEAIEQELQRSDTLLQEYLKNGETHKIYLEIKNITQKHKHIKSHPDDIGESYFDDELVGLRKEKDAANKAHLNNPRNNALREQAKYKTNEFRSKLRRLRYAYNERLRILQYDLYKKGLTSLARQLLNIPSKLEEKWLDVPLTATSSQKKAVKEHMQSLFKDRYQEEPYQTHRDGYRNKTPSKKEINNAVNQLKKNASAGEDGITPAMWIMIHDKLPEVLHTIIMDIWNDSTKLPPEWSLYRMTLIAKSAEAEHNPEQIRTIAIGQVIMKILSIIMTERLRLAAIRENMIIDTQFGFTEGRGLDEAHFLLTTITKHERLQGRAPIVAFIDFTKAFDLVNRGKLLNDLRRSGIDADLIDLIQEIYSKPMATIQALPEEIFSLLCGLLQGDPLSPLLFAIYIRKLPEYLQRRNNGIKVILYADDVAIIATNQDDMRNALADLELFCTEYDLTINTNKSEVMRVRNDDVRTPPLDFEIRNIRLKEVEAFTYLGLRTNAALTNRDIASHVSTITDIRISHIKRWAREVQHTAPFPLLKEIIQSKVRGGLAGYLPHISAKDADELDKKEARMWRSILTLHYKHPSVAIWRELDILPPSIQRKSAMHTLAYRLSTYHISSDITVARYIDLHVLPKSQSWHHLLPPLKEPGEGKIHYKRSFKKEYMMTTNSNLLRYANRIGTPTVHEVIPTHLLRLLPQGEERKFWEENISIQNISAILRLRASCIGLGHNHAHLNEQSHICRLCDRNTLETEDHWLLRCPNLDSKRSESDLKEPWFHRRRYELNEDQYIRIIRQTPSMILANLILFMKRAREEYLANLSI